MDQFRQPCLYDGYLGESIPKDVHAVSVSLPTWQASLGYVRREPTILGAMRTGYPRFFVHLCIKDLTAKVIQSYHTSTINEKSAAQRFPSEHGLGMLFLTEQHASKCRDFLVREAGDMGYIQETEVLVASMGLSDIQNQAYVDWTNLQLFVVIYPRELFLLAKAFWQHTGYGVSSRYAELYVKYFESVKFSPIGSSPSMKLAAQSQGSGQVREMVRAEIFKNNSLDCKLVLRQRLQDLYTNSDNIERDDVYLYSSGMSAITGVVDAVSTANLHTESHEFICYGFLYVDTFKVLSRVLQIKTTLYGNASSLELDKLENELKAGRRIRAMLLEVPGNPLLITPDLLRIRRMADTFNFVVICDDTISTPINTNLLSIADVICSSLTKMFSGTCNVMGGSVVLNPRSRHLNILRQSMSNAYKDTLFPIDAAVLEVSSRDFRERVLKANVNAEAVYDLLVQDNIIDHVFYPKGSTTQHYYNEVKSCQGGYGYLLSIAFKTPEQAISFFDALDVAKGPSLGTNFTLACAYTLLAHYNELEWAAQYGVLEHLVRISVGLEEVAVLKHKIKSALDIARYASKGHE